MPNTNLEITALAPDVFRLRIKGASEGQAAGGERGSVMDCGGSPPLSVAVGTGNAPRTPKPNGVSSRHRVTLATTVGKLTLHRRSGAWTLHDSGGLEVFHCSQLSLADAQPQLTFQLADGEAIFGLGESTGPFNKRGLIREFWNADVLGHASCIHPSLRNLYVSIPFALSLREGRAAGLFWDNPARQTWDIGCTEPSEFRLRAGTGNGSLYLFLGPTPADVLASFTELTGRMPLPPRWALGYQQSRYGYASRAEVERIAREFRRRKIPCDALHLDIHHMDEHRVFTFGKSFPRPAEMLAKLVRRGFKAVAIVDPGVKDDPKFGVLKRGLAQRAFVKAPGGKRDFIGKVWPGKSRFPDFLSARVRQWWAQEQADFQRLGLAGIWNDMNEPALFDTPGKTLPDDCVHGCEADPLVRHDSLAELRTELGDRSVPLTPAPHALVHNLYGSAMAAASRKGALLAAPDQRPFILTRAGYAGIQRHAAVWTGDNSSTWEHLAESIPMLLNLSLSGVAFCGADVGGFLDHCTGELLARWTQMAAFTPFFRNHANNDSRSQEPWAFGPAVEARCRDAIALRYQLVPYLNCLFAEAHRTGAPIMRPLLWHHPNDPAAVACEDQFLLGESLLVAPILRPEARVRSVYLPVGQWFDFWSGELYDGGQHVLVETVPEHIPVFVRGGSVVPTAAPRQFISGEADPVVNLHVWPHGRCAFTWQEDDGESLGYERGELATRMIEFVDRAPRRELVLGTTQGAWASRVQTWRIVLRSARRAYRVWVNGSRVETGFEPELGVCLFDVANAPGELRIKWL